MKHIPKYLLALLFLGTALGFFAENFTEEMWVWIPAFAVAVFVVWRFRGMIDRQPFSRFILVFSFMFLISIPLIGKKEAESYEKRALAEFPGFRFSNPWKFFFGFTDWFNDRFAFRNEAVQSISKFRLRTFKISTMPRIVEWGEGNWLFTTRKEYVEDTSIPFTEAQLDTVEKNLEIITRYFDTKGIKYYFAMIPVKERIYPEYMSELLRYRMRFSKQAQIYERIASNPNIRSVDVKDVLIEGKKGRPTFYTTDTHWNQYGCFLAYRKIIDKIRQDFPEVQPSKMSDYEISNYVTDAGDLQILMGFRDEFKFERMHFTHKSGVKLISTDGDTAEVGEHKKYQAYTMSGVNNNLRLALIRDSFSEYLKLFICRDFSRSDLVWTPKLPVKEILAAKPDIVLQEILEMFVMNTLVLPDEIKNDKNFMKENFPGWVIK